MCTVTIVPRLDGFRIVSNRDERCDRAPATLPACHALRGRTAMFPVDPEGNGTWIGVNDAVLAAALLNRNAAVPPAARRTRTSRGAIVPWALQHDSLDAAIDAIARLTPSCFEPFHLVLIQDGLIADIISNGAVLSRRVTSITVPRLLTSSSLGDAFVEPQRRLLFERLVVADPTRWLDGQYRFHRHQWPALPEYSVVMTRPGARTVSRTVVDVGGTSFEVSYEPLGTSDSTLDKAGDACSRFFPSPSEPSCPRISPALRPGC